MQVVAPRGCARVHARLTSAGGQLPQVVGGAVVVPLEDLGTGGGAHVGHPEQQPAVVVGDLVVAVARRDQLPEVVGGAVVAPDQGGAAVGGTRVGDAEEQAARLLLD